MAVAGPQGDGTTRSAARDTAALFDTATRLGRDLAAVDWEATPLGPPSSWQGSLRNVVRLMVGSRFAMWMAWGPELTFFCNDAYRLNTLGTKYPWALGRRADEVWQEIWPDIGPLIDSVIRERNATWSEDLLLFLERSGYQEETYHTFSYSPITDDAGVVAGMLCVVSEETARVISERRMRIVRDLSSELAAASTRNDVYEAAARMLSGDGRSIPFCVGYLFDRDTATNEEVARRVLTAGIAADHVLAPRTIPVMPRRAGEFPDRGAVWPVASVAAGHVELVEDLDVRFDGVPTGSWDEPPRRAIVLPFIQAGEHRPFGFIALALNRYRELDADYRGFLHVVASQLAAAISRAQAFEEERRRAEELAELDRAKTLFFTNVSHELRTPLTLLLGPAGDALVDTENPLPDPQRARIEVVERNAERLLKLVNTLLDFSRMQSGQAQGTFEPVDLARWTTELAAMFDSAMRRAGLSFTLDCPPLPEPVYVDREMWAKIVLNLLSNALKATFSGGITVRLAAVAGGPAGPAAELTVTDTGVGIPAGERQRLFERFHRVTGARLRSHEGSGIGLALVAELAQVHGGTVDVDSEPGVGSTFVVRVPFGTDHLPAARVVSRSSNTADAAALGIGYLAEADRWLVDQSLPAAEAVPATVPATEPAAEPREQPGPGVASVLVVDDNADMRQYVSSLLAPHYRVSTAVDGNDGVARARRELPDLVLTDVMMPGLDGFGLLAALRASPETMHIPVVMLSARSGEDAAVVGLEAGADDYLVKPFSTRELLARVRSNLELDRVRRVHGELQRSRELLDQAEQLAHVGSWQIDLRDGTVVTSAEFAQIVGVRPATTADGLVDLLPLVAAADRDRLLAAYEATRTTGAPFAVEVRLERAEGDERIVHAVAVLHRDEHGEPAVVRGSIQDITEQRAAQQALADSHAIREAAAREHAIAEQLQRSLLPAGVPRRRDLDIAVFYASGVEDTQAGGDWYDVIPLPGERTAVIIGDVMGRGVRAAAVMGQLRAMIRAYAGLDLGVPATLRQLDAEVAAVSAGTIVTCVYAVVDPAAETLTYGCAGHVPPLLTLPDGTVRRLEAGDPPLGTGGYRGRTEAVPWTTGTRLTLYTDGLVEHRGGDLDAAIDDLAKLLRTKDLLAEEVPNALVEALVPGRLTDDVAVVHVAARLPNCPDMAMAIPPVESSLAEARRATSAALRQWGVADDVHDDAVLIVSELVTNTLRHGTPPVELMLRVDGDRLVIDVSDAALPQPRLRAMDPSAPGGRGLHLVEALSQNWGTRPWGNGKSVWCVLALR